MSVPNAFPISKYILRSEVPKHGKQFQSLPNSSTFLHLKTGSQNPLFQRQAFIWYDCLLAPQEWRRAYNGL
jgi:hypothetical protein